MNLSKTLALSLPLIASLAGCGTSSTPSTVKSGPAITGTPATVCGKLMLQNICASLPGCPEPFLSVPGHVYTISSFNTTVSQNLRGLANKNVCINGVVNADGDPDLLVAYSVRAL